MARKSKKSAEPYLGYRYLSPDIPMSAIRHYARQLAERFQPDRTILFGSYAYGEPHEWSDVDILVVMSVYDEVNQSIRIMNTLDAPYALRCRVPIPDQESRPQKSPDRTSLCGVHTEGDPHPTGPAAMSSGWPPPESR
jgi:predicted nucleotidyltransferase